MPHLWKQNGILTKKTCLWCIGKNFVRTNTLIQKKIKLAQFYSDLSTTQSFKEGGAIYNKGIQGRLGYEIQSPEELLTLILMGDVWGAGG